ncbi:endonuclease/exonuclease/phosphatase family protein [Dactylosporangium sp. NPDC048998]|uniref:endonuclease/exonuclease/phosphatase family protein n=1 Tax=Dactylosporangium sp. NPDC048998 TaxID=3363976 RepID=UPI0037194145
MRRSSYAAVVAAVLLGGLLTFHGAVPNRPGHLGSLLEAFLPWLGLAVPILLGVAVWRRSIPMLISVLVAVVAWLAAFGGQMLPAGGGPADLVAVQHNVSDENPDPAGTARALTQPRPDLIGLEEVTPEALPAYAAVLEAQYPHHTVQGTVGLWSRYPLADARAIDIKPRGLDADWNRGLRAVVQAPGGDIAVYVAHLPSVRIGLRKGFNTAWRDDSAARLGALLATEPIPHVILLGDLNSTVDDRGLRPVSSRLTWASSGFAWSFPARAPIARIDQIMARSATVTGVRALPATGSDHLPIAARIRLHR